MIQSELIETIYRKQTGLTANDVENVVKCLLEKMTKDLASGERVEVRGFGSFSLKCREPRQGRNPRTGAPVLLSKRYAVHFKAGLELKHRVAESAKHFRICD